jgi:UDPglucose--hexose-1-phosphate uridylyltransferase
MADFQFLKNPATQKWVITAPRRSKRTNVGIEQTAVCPFCIGTETNEQELYRVGGKAGDANWYIRVMENKFPFVENHELVIHSPDHHKNFDELALSHVELLLQTYRARFLANQKKGHVYIFHNRGVEAGESIPHPHTQIAVVPFSVGLEIPPLDMSLYNQQSKETERNIFSLIHKSLFAISKKGRPVQSRQGVVDNGRKDVLDTEHFRVFCPETSEWPDEVWIAPKQKGETFGLITDTQIKDLAFVLSRVIHIMDHRHGHEFPFNFYIYPGKNWYFRLIPRIKILGGFEIGTGIMVNTQKPLETIAFLKRHFHDPDFEEIKNEYKADYLKSV